MFVFNYGYLIYPTNRSLVISHSRYDLVFFTNSMYWNFSLLMFIWIYFPVDMWIWLYDFERFVYIILRVCMRVIGIWISFVEIFSISGDVYDGFSIIKLPVLVSIWSET